MSWNRVAQRSSPFIGKGERNVLLILSDNSDTNADAFELLLDQKFTECSVSENVAVCQTEDPDKKLAPSIRSNRIDKILVVSDDDGRSRDDSQTGAILSIKMC